MPKETESGTQDAPLMLSHADYSNNSGTAQNETDASVHLANERTFLAWCFVGIVLIGSGVALARALIALNSSVLVDHAGSPISSMFYPTTMGLLFLGGGLIVMVMATCRYLSVQKQIVQRNYRPTSTMALLFLAIILGLGIVLAGFLLQLRGAFLSSTS